MLQETRISNHRLSWVALGMFATALTACDVDKPAPQASRDAGDQIVERAPSPAAGNPNDMARSDPMEPGKGSATSPGPQAFDDTAINIKVQDALTSNFRLKALPILVQTTDGVVTLSGTADTPANREQAERVAKNVAGVKSVQNNLKVSGA